MTLIRQTEGKWLCKGRLEENSFDAPNMTDWWYTAACPVEAFPLAHQRLIKDLALTCQC